VTLRELAPFAPDGLDVYSTLLWHLHRPTQLSYLAQDLIELSPTQPYAWIATGNVFSHLEDHANALKCFKRAIQCDSAFPYAYTLAGHESVTMDEWDVAIGFFREAIRRQPRHYNAW
jgi:anaphase-promoting complex subunit 3